MSLKRNRSYHTVRLKQAEQRPFTSFWNLVLQNRGGENAIFSDNGSVLRRFQDIEQERILWRSRLAAFSAADCLVAAVGNDPTWPALLLACWDLALVVVPVEPDVRITPDLVGERLERLGQTSGAEGRTVQVADQRTDPIRRLLLGFADLVELHADVIDIALVQQFSGDIHLQR